MPQACVGAAGANPADAHGATGEPLRPQGEGEAAPECSAEQLGQPSPKANLPQYKRVLEY